MIEFVIESSRYSMFECTVSTVTYHIALYSKELSTLITFVYLFLQNKVEELERLSNYRKAKLTDNSAFLQFNWKTDVVESWISMF